jgi:hypothetical protein
MSQLSNKAMAYWNKRQQTMAIDTVLQEQGPRGQYEPHHWLQVHAMIVVTHILFLEAPRQAKTKALGEKGSATLSSFPCR